MIMIETEYGIYPKTIYTHFGTASIQNGYYKIASTKEGNHNKRLHRLIWEKYNGPIPEGHVIHHKDQNKLNNNINNLQCMKWSEHNILHNTGKPSLLKGKKSPKTTGENNGRTKINKVGAACIKILLQYTDLTHQEITDSIPGATREIVNQINQGNNWKSVTIYDFKS